MNDIKDIPDGTSPIILKLIEKYTLIKSILMAKYENGTYHAGSFSG